jgi:23S rRNA (pseudouridine1915-N3)-methyltransferase
MYTKRINFYNRFNITYIPDIRNSKILSEAQQKTAEGEAILRLLDESDRVVLLDEKGSEFRSVEYADWLQKRMNSGVKRLVFIIGGPYGFSPEVYSRSNEKISLSKMTFSHQIIRAIFTEQLYRAFSILHNSPYHHE